LTGKLRVCNSGLTERSLRDRKEVCPYMSKKADILKAATALFAHKGFQDATISEISKLTGAAEGTIFYHFKSKEHLLLVILEDAKTRIIEEFDKYFEGKTFPSGLRMMEEVVSFYIYLAGMMDNQFLLLHRHFPYQLADTNPECRAYLEAIYNCLVDIFEQALVLGQEDGSMAEFHPRKTAMILFSMVDGLVRFKNYNLYDAGALYVDLIESCRRMLQKT